MKVTVIGGGSSYTPELVNGFLERTGTFPLDELWLVDVLPERLEVVGGFAQRMAHAAGDPFRIVLTTDRRAGIAGASYVTTQLRVGWMEARRQDEYLGKRYGLVGQETTGVGGMAKALRTIPVLLGIARDMAELAPGALLVNFTNPAGLVTEALARYAPGRAGSGRLQRAHHRQDALPGALARHDRGCDTSRARPAPDPGPQPPLVAPRLHHRRRGRVAAAPHPLPGRVAHRAPIPPGSRASSSRCDGSELLSALFL